MYNEARHNRKPLWVLQPLSAATATRGSTWTRGGCWAGGGGFGLNFHAGAAGGGSVGVGDGSLNSLLGEAVRVSQNGRLGAQLTQCIQHH